MKQNLIPLSERTMWTTALQKLPHAFGHTWESCYAMSLTTGLDTYLYHFEDNGTHIVCPISERTYQGHIDIFTPYGFSGFIGNKECTDFPLIWKKFAEERNYICGYIMVNPFLNGTASCFAEGAVHVNDLYSLDLSISMDDLFSNLSTNRKRQVKNHSEILSTFSLDKGHLKPFFIENFHKFFKGRDAALFSGFTVDTLSNLIDLENVVMIGKMSNSKIEAVSVFAYTPYVAEYLFNISLPEGKGHTVSLLWEGIRTLKGKGVTVLNLGGGIAEGDSLAEFKKRFGAEKHPLRVLKQIYNHEIFQELCENARVSDQEKYFPPYRKKTPVIQYK